MSTLPPFIGPYKVLRRIGTGGMGQVHECITGGGARVAVKTIRDEYRQHPEVRERFRSEIAASKAIRGPYVADYFDSNEDELWLATRYYPWPSIRDHVQEHGPLSVKDTAELAGRVAEALHNIHAAGRVHRDLSPANILYLNGDVRVIDYGISKDLSIGHGDGITGGRPAPYTWRYASPEHIGGKPVDELSDYFSLGCVLAYAATGHELLDDLRVKRLEIVPVALRTLVIALTQDHPDSRPAYQEILRWTASLNTSPGGSGVTRAVSSNTSGPNRLAVAQLLDNHLDVFATDNQPGRILHRWHSGVTGWSAWAAVHLPDRHSDRLPQQLTAATRPAGNSDILVVLDNGIILHRSHWPSNGWSEWMDFDRGFSAGPIAAAATPGNRLNVFTVNGEGCLVQRLQQADGPWTRWSRKHLPAGSEGRTVTHLAAAGTPAGDCHLMVGLDNGALAYSAQRYQGLWSKWVWVSENRDLRCLTLRADERGARGVFAASLRVGDHFFAEHWHSWGRPWNDFETILAQRVPDPWGERIIVDLGSSLSGDGCWDVFALLDDGTILHRTTSGDRKTEEWNAVQDSEEVDRTHRLPPLPPTRPLTNRGD